MVQIQGLAVAATAFAHHVTAAIQMYPSPWATGVDKEWVEAYAKARDFVSQLTVTEKVNLTTGTGWEMDRCVGMTGGIPRFNFSALCLQDSPVGVRYGDFASVFPAGINAAATWSRSLLRRRGAAMGDEFRGKGVDVQLGPVVGPLGRFPEGGRNWEGFGPDPWLAGASVAETIRGIQSAGVIATAKHFVMNEQEHYRSRMDVRIDDKTMHEVYLWPFADAVRAGVGAVMCSYNKINGANSCEQPWTSNYLLKNELNFQGFLMSDWNGQHSTVNSALSGLDMSMPGDKPVYWGSELTAAVMAGVIPQWRLDDMAVRIMAAYFKMHVGNRTSRVPINFSSWTNATYGYVNYAVNLTVRLINEHVDVFTPNKALARELAAKSIVLLKNENRVLPLGDTPKSIAVIGEDAQDNPDGPNACPDRRCDTGTLAMGYGSGTSDFPYLVSPYNALAAEANRRGVSLTNVPGNYDLAAAQRAAASADVALVFANADAGEGYLTIDGNTGDRNNLTLWKGGDALVQAVAAVNPRTVLVLHTVGPVLLEAYRTHPNVSAIVWAGLPGQESGNALVDVLYGATNPQGKTVFTWGKNPEDWGVSLVFNAPNPSAPSQEVSDTLIDYRYFDKYGIKPSYEFGFGLSYTTFKFSDLDITRHVDALARGYSPPANNMTGAAKTYGVIDNSTAGVQAAMMPAGFDAIPKYVYSWLSASGLSGVARNQTVPAGSLDSGPQPVLPASGAPGGNPSLYDVLFTVSATVTNTGSVNGTEIAQLYVAFGDPNEPVRVLRGFEEVELNAGASSVVSFSLTRRDLSNWDTASQNWVLGKFNMSVAVGSSSRTLPLNGTLAL